MNGAAQTVAILDLLPQGVVIVKVAEKVASMPQGL